MNRKLIVSATCLLIMHHAPGYATNQVFSDDNLNIEFFDPGAEPEQDEPELHMVIYQQKQENTVSEYTEIPNAENDDFTVDVYLESGYRHDDIVWNKAHPSGTPNILSELTWSDLEIAIFEVGTRMTVFNDWVVEGKVAYGQIVAGNNQDSDYFGNNRTFEFSRSNNNADSGSTLDLSLGFGYQFDIGRLPWLQLTPKVGFSYHAQNLDITDGYQTIPAFGSFSGLDSSYDTNWYGAWAGLETKFNFTKRLDLSTSIEYHAIKYEANANWNLRGDLQHPESFRHKAYGDGIIASAKTRYAITPEWKLNLSADYQTWKADKDGRDHMFFANGAEAEMKLNEVRWDSYGFNFGVEYEF